MRTIGAKVMRKFTTVIPTEIHGPQSGSAFERMSLL